MSIIYYRLLPESIPWLVAMGRVAEAKTILNKAAAFNKVKLPEQFQLTEEESSAPVLSAKERLASVKEIFKKKPQEQNGVSKGKEEEEVGQVKRYSIIDIICSCRLFVFSIIMAYLW